MSARARTVHVRPRSPVARVEAAFDALGSPTRRRLLELLGSGPQTVRALAEQLPVSRPAVSQHLAALLAAGLVECEVRGRSHAYALARAGFGAAREYLDGFWAEALARFRLVADHLEDVDG